MKTIAKKELKKSRTHQTIRKSENVPVGSFYNHKHYLIDCNTSERVLRTFIQWCETGNENQFKEDIQALKEVYGTDYTKKMKFSKDEY